MSEEKIYLYPRWVRLWHMMNAVFCLFLIITGVSMQFSNPKVPLIRFDLAVSVHNIFGILLIINYLFFFIANLFTWNGKYYKIEFRGFYQRVMAQFRYYTRGIFKGEHPPFPITKARKFNPLQQFSYVLVMYIMVPVMVISGLGLLYPNVIPTQLWGLSGLHITDLLHILAGFVISLFMFVHVYFCTIGKTPVSNFISMLTGYHEPH
ncbi:MAG: cytochrome b/b6 domain-containing protein [Bacteroidetes bacterium]|nr:cytochrome b/b6 domain-containing protein [Bacteroidota bacterium]